jgi:hypothetical protein
MFLGVSAYKLSTRAGAKPEAYIDQFEQISIGQRVFTI